MQDPRIRTAIAAVLSLAAFLSIQGAAAVFLWWLVFTPSVQLAKRIRRVFSLILMITFFSLVLEIYGGGGLSYFTRMTVIVLIGMWVYSEQKSGEFLGIGVWLLGNRAGFELGMIAEMGMQSLSSVAADFERIQMAQKIKGIKWGVHSLVPAGLVLVHGALIRAEDTAELLAVRGYHSGGTMCPKFSTRPMDVVAGIIAIIILLFTLIPFSEFFILYR
jgi:energy-coupling factor transporter transmembrane protein EcfT